jgi:GNAT superfamily N-acetyltransferase
MASYWGGARTDALNRRAFENSLCGAVFHEGNQVAFARVITDYAVFAYFSDVMVWPEQRGKGIGPILVQAFLDHPELASVCHWSLTTSDAHGLYEKFGFHPSTDGRYMRLDRML